MDTDTFTALYSGILLIVFFFGLSQVYKFLKIIEKAYSENNPETSDDEDDIDHEEDTETKNN